jgi:uncharacterized protein (TIGR02301 family)
MTMPSFIRSMSLAVLCAVPLALSVPARAAEAPYEKQLQRLAEVLGSVQYLRTLCGEEGNLWRERMEALLQSEDPDPARRSMLVASYNHGYRTFHDSYQSCTASAVEAIRRYMKEGEALAGELASRYGN